MSHASNFYRAFIKALSDSSEIQEELVRKVVTFSNRMEREIIDSGPILSSASETVVVTGTNRKTAALFFDRVWSTPGGSENTPIEIAVYGATKIEQCILPYYALRLYLLQQLVNLHERNLSRIKNAISHPGQHRKQESADELNCALNLLKQTYINENFDFEKSTDHAFRTVALTLYQEHGLQALPMYSSRESNEFEYESGKTTVVVAAIQDLKLVDNEKLTWDQVREFRRDQEAKRKLRRMRNWLDAEAIGKSVTEISDLISVRLEEYEWALKKHGIQTLTGTISDLLDPTFLATAGPVVGSLWLGAGTGLAELAGAGIVVGKAIVSVSNRSINFFDQKRGVGSEVAFVHELKKLQD